MSEYKKSIKRATRRAFRVRERIKKDTTLPRISVFRSLKQIYAQLIDDAKGVTLASSSSLQMKSSENKSVVARDVGKQLAAHAKSLKIEKIVFDRGSYLYHGRVREFAEGLREGGLQF